MRSSVVFAVLLALSAALLAWWLTFAVREAGALERAGESLIAADVDAAARAFGADDRFGLAELARGRRRMFLSEAVVFALAIVVAALLFVASKRAERRVLTSYSRFLAGATHELKTPLATIRLGLETVADERLDATARARYLRAMLGETGRLERGISNLLASAALRAEGVVLHEELGDLADDLRAAVLAMQARADAAGVSLELGATSSAPADRDAHALRLLLHNLIDNAIKFSARGGVVRVALAVDGDRARILIDDHGLGIAGADLARIFEPFWRGDHAAGGAGLGLHLARELARAHGGEIEARSEGPGRGASFVVDLPLAARPAP
ncbi:MAG: HAMP domain-containing histidine kinase [Planctomycetes bacterium]|nr:HAMP domain-containing histidine kinase [Planctomycetota bacterium]